MQSPIYWHPWLYRTAMKLSYGDKFEARYKLLARHIPDQGSLLELCMGDAYLSLNYLKEKNSRYTCADINPVFIHAARKQGLQAQLFDITDTDIPQADHILLQGSLYHFIPNEQQLIRRLLEACRQKVIISESTENLSNAKSPLRSAIGTWLSKARTGQSKLKFTEASLRESFAPFKDHIEVWEASPGNREVIIVLKK